MLTALTGIAVVLSACSSPGQVASPPNQAKSHPKPTSSVGSRTTSTTSTSTTESPGQSAWASQGNGVAPAVSPRAVPDQSLDSVFAGQLGPGWVGADSTYSTELPDGQVAFVFSDTFIGTAQTSGTVNFTGMAHSSELVGRLPNLASDYGGTYQAPQSLIPDTDDPKGIWETAATYTQDNNQLIFVNEYTGPPGILTLSYTGRSGIAVMSTGSNGLPTPSSVVLLPQDATTAWGSAEVTSGGYVYVYGAVLDHANHGVYGMKVARIPIGQSLDVSSWTYWAGSEWKAGETNAAIVQTLNELTGVVADPDGNGFIGVSIPPGLFNDRTVDLSYAPSPEGPWTAPQSVYVIPELKMYAGEEAYFPTFHPELSTSGSLVVSYNIDTTVGYSVLESDIHSYQPKFLIISG